MTTTAHDIITTANVSEIDADLVKSMTEYAHRRPPGVPRNHWRAYGDHYPGGPKRAAEARAAGQRLREQADQRRREQVARGLWARAHRQVVA